MAACTKAVRERSACQAWINAEEIHQHHDPQRLEASTSGRVGSSRMPRGSTAVVGECPREWERKAARADKSLLFWGGAVSREVSTTVDTNCPPDGGQASRSPAPTVGCGFRLKPRTCPRRASRTRARSPGRARPLPGATMERVAGMMKAAPAPITPRLPAIGSMAVSSRPQRLSIARTAVR